MTREQIDGRVTSFHSKLQSLMTKVHDHSKGRLVDDKTNGKDESTQQDSLRKFYKANQSINSITSHNS